MAKAGPTYLKQLQESAFSRLGVVPPTYDVDTFLATKQRNLSVLSKRGIFETELSEALKAANLDTGIAAILVDQMRVAEEQVDDKSYQNVRAAWDSRPTPYEHPTSHFLLSKSVQDIVSATRIYPEFQLEELSRRITLGTLSTGEVNATSIPVPGTNEFIIAFDPEVFDFLYALSNDFAAALAEVLGAMGSNTFGSQLRETLSGDKRIAQRLLLTLSQMIVTGRPPIDYPLTGPANELANSLRQATLTFIVAHECGHILLNHFSVPEDIRAEDVNMWRQYRRYDQEFEADRIGSDISVAAMGVFDSARNRAFSGSAFFLSSSRLLELAIGTLNGTPRRMRDFEPADHDRPLGATHPTPFRRFSALDGWLAHSSAGSAPDKQLVLERTRRSALMIFSVFEQLWEEVLPFVIRLHQQGAKSAFLWKGMQLWPSASASQGTGGS